MTTAAEADILTAAQPLRVPGQGERRVLSPMAVERLATEADCPRWLVEAQALDLGIVPLHYLRNLARFSMDGQARLLRSTVALVGSGPVIDRAGEMLAVNGVGRLAFRITWPTDEAPAEAARARAMASARNRNASTELEAVSLSLTGGNPSAAVRGADAVVGCLPLNSEEQLLQFACRMARAPLVLAGTEGQKAQLTTVLPGDPGVAVVYKPSHSHLEGSRPPDPEANQATLIVSAWVAEQVTALLLGSDDLARGRLRYLDLDAGEMTEYPL